MMGFTVELKTLCPHFSLIILQIIPFHRLPVKKTNSLVVREESEINKNMRIIMLSVCGLNKC